MIRQEYLHNPLFIIGISLNLPDPVGVKNTRHINQARAEH